MYSTRHVAELLGLQESRLRYWAQTGFVGPSERDGQGGTYTFQDLIAVRTAKELVDKGFSLQRVRKMLEALKQKLPGVPRPLSELRIVSDGDELVVTTVGESFEPLSGQLVMDFSAESIDCPAADIKPIAATQNNFQTGLEWFLHGLALESDQQAAAAIESYQRALALDPTLGCAHTNLGNLAFARREFAEAETHYQRALTVDPDQPEARFNLGNLYDERDEHERAIAEWYRVLAIAPDFIDAHYNLALGLLRQGALKSARQHLEDYLRSDQGGHFAELAKRLLQTMAT